MKLTNRKEIWIQRNEETNSLTVAGEWYDTPAKTQFTKAEANEIFNCIKDAIQAKWPNMTVNSWIDAESGTLD